MLASAAAVLFDGFAYGMLLFLLSVGLTVTLGMMNFVNLAHCSFAMVGGYATITLVNRFGWPFLASLPMAFLMGALVSIVLERTLYRRLYRARRPASGPRTSEGLSRQQEDNPRHACSGSAS